VTPKRTGIATSSLRITNCSMGSGPCAQMLTAWKSGIAFSVNTMPFMLAGPT